MLLTCRLWRIRSRWVEKLTRESSETWEFQPANSVRTSCLVLEKKCCLEFIPTTTSRIKSSEFKHELCSAGFALFDRPTSFPSGEWMKTHWKSSMKQWHNLLPFFETFVSQQIDELGDFVLIRNPFFIDCSMNPLHRDGALKYLPRCAVSEKTNGEPTTNAASNGVILQVSCIGFTLIIASCWCCSPTRRTWRTSACSQSSTSSTVPMEMVKNTVRQQTWMQFQVLALWKKQEQANKSKM